VELCEPAAAIFNNITRTGQWVEDWKQEFGTPLKKVPVPANEESLRIIAITNHFSLIYERFVLKWVLHYIQDKLDPDQFGGQKGHSVAHYLIEVQNAILYNQDLDKPYATVLTAIDISKGFNLIAHNEVITRISDMGCPGWLTKILVSYLSGRTLQIRWQDKISRKLPLNSGSGQGTILGLLFFVVIFNGAGPKPAVEALGVAITQTRRKRKPLKAGKKKWVDDCTLTAHVRLSENLVPDPGPAVIGPAQYHCRTGQTLPPDRNEMQYMLDSLSEYCRQSKLKINQEKSKAMLFNRAKKHDFSPKLSLLPGQELEVVEELKLVGYQLRSDMRTISNTEYIVKRAWKRMWVVRRLKALGASEKELLNVLRAQVLSVLQFATPAWSTLITGQESNRIESVLRTGLYLVYGDRFQSFSWALREAKMSSMKEQRKKMFEKFTRDCINSTKFKNWFVRTENNSGTVTRRRKTLFKPVLGRTQGFLRSAIPQMVKLANSPGFLASKKKLILNSGQIVLI
jgi:hypothetical protein